MGTENKLVLVLGGARSGKSEFAEKYVLHAGNLCGYIATAEILDEEMAERVKLHRSRREKRWITFEAPYFAEQVFPEAGERTDAILFDDITIYRHKEESWPKGDVNHDGEVNIADVNALSDAILSGNNDTVYDVNEDAEVSIADVNTVIDIILAL